MIVAAVSDVTIGYGTPQLPLITQSLVEHYSAAGTIVEPAQPEAPPRHHLFPGLDVRRVTTMVHPHSEHGRQEYIWRAARIIDALKPDVLVICCTYSLPVLFRIRHRPRCVIYYSVESIGFYGAFDEEMNRWLEGCVDLVLFPEENRAVNEVRRYGFHSARKLVVYNATKRASQLNDPLPAASRNGRILYSGTLDPDATLARYFLSEHITTAIDLYGPLKMPNAAERERFLHALTRNVHYRGYISSDELATARRSYIYSIVMWNPSNENQLYAAPNKFFESIADGVPPIAAPHPQCKSLIDRYGCGILMDDWSFDAFRAALQRAWAMANTAQWEDMVANCMRAAKAELNWDAQFEKVRKFLN